jgi:hypothetical protein
MAQEHEKENNTYYIDVNGYVRYRDSKRLVHRDLAYKYIYKPNKEKYNLSFGDYIVHHKDGNKLNNKVSNLKIETQKDHEVGHGIAEDKKATNKDVNKVLVDFISQPEVKPVENSNIKEGWIIKPKTTIEIDGRKLRKIIRKKGLPKQQLKKIIRKKESKIDEPPQELIREEEKPKKYQPKTELTIKKDTPIKTVWVSVKEKDYYCNICGRRINHIGNCWPCNTKLKRERNIKRGLKFIGVLILFVAILGVFKHFGVEPQPAQIVQPVIEKNKPTPIILDNAPSMPLPTPSTPKVEPLIVEGSRRDVIITNNQNKSVSVEVTYHITSTWFGADYKETKVFDVEASSKQSFKVYDNAGCDTAPCSVGIVDYKEVDK